MLPFLLSIFAITSDAWLEDFRQLQHEMSTHYANLDSAIDDRKMDLPDLRRRTEEALRKAKSDEEARQALDAFMRAFGDGHASINWTTTTATTSEAATLCDRLRYRSREDNSGVDFVRLSEFTAIADDDSKTVPGGILKLSGDRRVGVIRILLFSAGIHPQLCQAAMKSLALTEETKCDDVCGHHVDRMASDQFTAALERRVESLVRAGAKSIAVDLTGNGGGSDWVEPAARVLTPIPLRSPRLGFIRHQHWQRILNERLADVEHDLAAGGEPRERLIEGRNKIARAIEEASKTCDRNGLWLDEPKRPDCSLIVSDVLFASGVIQYATPGSVPQGWAMTSLFKPSEFTYREGVNRLPLYVLIDQRTASAAELFAAMLKDNQAATLIGMHTRGAGCGHTNGGISTTLKNSGARVSLPDCVRFRADGTNEVVGITPDVIVPWSAFESRYQRAGKTLKILDRVVR